MYRAHGYNVIVSWFWALGYGEGAHHYNLICFQAHLEGGAKSQCSGLVVEDDRKPRHDRWVVLGNSCHVEVHV
jgi:hypothetical protein